jgi:uridine phosphorylase
MQQFFPESELILNANGSIYHLHLRPEQLAETIITVGDPDRVQSVSKYFDRVTDRVQHREFVTHTGELGGKRISVVATGIGTDNIDIVFNELDALVNIDFQTRTVKPDLTSLTIVRVGTSGCLQADIPVDTILASEYGLGLDALMDYYEFEDDAPDILEAFIAEWDEGGLPYPYLIACDAGLLATVGKGLPKGITATCPGFYAPQGRVLRGRAFMPDLVQRLSGFRYKKHFISNFEMETAGIYGMGQVLGHKTLSINALLANRITHEFSKNAEATVDKAIKMVLERI